MLSAHDVGHRVVIRRVAGSRDGRQLYSDVLGELREWGEHLVVATAGGELVTVPLAEVAAGKRIPPKPVIGDRQSRRAPGAGTGPVGVPILELERIAALGWRGLRTEWLGRWLLRSAGGFTGRANSVLPQGDPGLPLGEAIERVEAWYRAQGLPPMVQVPLPELAGLRDELTARGWTDGWGALVHTAGCAEVLASVPDRPDLPLVEIAAEPPEGWLELYHYRGGELPPNAMAVLLTGEHRRFAQVREGGQTVAVARIVVDEGWAGVAALEVHPGHRRRGLGGHLLRATAQHGASHGAHSVYLQVEDSNQPARALYAQAGFSVHHTYRYLRAPA